MQLSRNWLAEYVELPDSDRELADRLTAAGLAVEGMEERGDDLLLDVDVTTNRPDCMNHLGLAREVAALFGRPLRPPVAGGEEASEAAGDRVRVEIEDRDCLRYVARIVRGVRVGRSPEWLVRRLESIGQRSINNVVDVTNFVLWETGQPIHAFDLDKLRGGRIVVRSALPGETLVTLDGERRELAPEVLVIADAERAVALAGIMGGLDTEVTDEAADVLIESAHFERRRIRRGAALLGLHTDASHRFERGADPEACAEAAERVAWLLAEIAGGTVLAGAVDRRARALPRLSGVVDTDRLSAFAGMRVAPEFVASSLAAIGFGVEADGEARFRVSVPSWRWYDFADGMPGGEVWEADLFEEVLRLKGFDDIPSDLPALGAPDEGSSAEHELRRRLRGQLAACGLVEAVNYAFQAPDEERRFAALERSGEPVRLSNPLSEKLSVMRRSLLPGLVESARFNLRRGAEELRLFEIGRCFPGGGADELETVAIVAGGGAGTPWDRPGAFDLFDLKGIVEAAAKAFGVELDARPAELDGLISGSTCRLEADGETVGHLGQVDGDFAYPLFAAELATRVLAGGGRDGHLRLPSRFPSIAVDLTLTHPLETSWAEIEGAIHAAGIPDLASFALKDRYRGEGVPDDAVNTTIRFLYNSDERSLTQEEVNAAHQRLADDLQRRFGWSG